MKLKNVLIMMILLGGCGIAEDLRKACGSDLDDVCNTLFGRLPKEPNINNYYTFHKHEYITLVEQHEHTTINEVVPGEYIKDYVIPCYDGNPWREVLVVTSKNNILVYLASGMNPAGNAKFPRLGLLSNGSYITTDGMSCHFDVTDYHIIWSGGIYLF